MVNASPLSYNHVLKAYMTQADAISDSNPLFVMSATIGGISNDTCDPHASSDVVATAHATHPDGYYHFFIFEEYWFRIESNGLCKEFEIDWDDGEDNSPAKSNTSRIILETPGTYGVTSHIFTKHGAHHPLIRVTSIKGFKSKWYTPNNVDNDFAALNSVLRVSSNNYDAGNNEFSNVTIEKANQPRIPMFFPSNKPPICILKTDRKEVFAGIDNSFIKDAKINSTTDPTVTITSENTTRTGAFIRILYMDSGGTANSASNAGDNVLIREVKKAHGETISACRRILRVELIDNRETTSATETDLLASGERIHITYIPEFTSAVSDPITICYVSLGNPILEEEDLGFYATFDATESRTRASNVTLHATKPYAFDFCRDRHIEIGDVRQANQIHSISPYFSENTNYGPTTFGVQKQSWSHSYNHNMLDADKRFLREGKLIEAQVRDSSGTTKGDDDYAGPDNDVIDVMEYSEIEQYEGKQYWNGDNDDDGTIETTTANQHTLRRPADLKRFSIALRTYDGHTGTPTWSDLKNSIYSTSVGEEVIDGASLSGTSLTSGDYKTFILIAKERKFDKIFLRTLHDDINAIFDSISINDGTTNVATSTITITDYTELAGADKVNLVATDATNYDFVQGDQSSVNGTFEATTSNDQTATNLMNVINTSSGPSGSRFTATVDGAVVTVSQATIGVDGNTTITLTDAGTAGMSKTNFTGGAGTATHNWPAIELQLFYPSIERGHQNVGSLDNHRRFKPLKFIDRTMFNRKRGTSLCRSGILTFDPPNDWEKTKKTLVNSNLGAANFLDGLAQEWDVDSYAVILVVGVHDSGGANSSLAKLKVTNLLVADSPNQQYIEIVDPTCLSLNNLVHTQSISFGRQGSYQTVTNRLGTAEIRKIGAKGGTVNFGGVDLSGDPQSTRDTCYRYQRDAVPVFLDANHENGDITRFFGVIIKMSEDHPTGVIKPKFGVSLQITKVAMFNSAGKFISEGLVSLGGEVDKPRFVGFGGHT